MGACPFLTAAMSSCIVLIEDLKTGVPGISAFGGVWTGRGLIPSFIGRLEGIGPPRLSPRFGEAGGEAGPPDDEVDPVKSRKAGTPGGLFDGVGCEPPVGGILICGLIGLDPLSESEGLVGSAMFAQRDTNTRITHELHERFVTFVPISVFVSGLFHCQINSTIVIYVFHADVDNLADL